MNGEYKGVTPYHYSDTKIVGSTNQVRLEKEGYETFNASFSRDEKADVGAIIGGIFFLFPFLWTMKYNPTHIYELRPNGHSSLDMKATPAMQTANGEEFASHVLR